VEGVGELVHVAAMTGAQMHLCHVNSTGWRRAPELLELLGRAEGFGLRLSTEMYPWGAASTVMGAPWFDPANLDHVGITPQDMFDASRGRRVRDADDLAAIRRETPGDIGVFFFLDEAAEDDVAVLDQVLAHPDVAVATDAVPYLSGGRPVDGQVWPLPDDALAHPRLAGTFCRTLRWQTRERRVLTLPEAIRRMTLVPARIVEAAAPGARRKARIQPGCDADVVVFDPDTVTERATYDAIARVKGVGTVRIFGARDYAMRIWLDPEKVASRNLTAGEVVAALRSQNVQVASGATRSAMLEVLLRTRRGTRGSST